jgi:hypothetical protein
MFGTRSWKMEVFSAVAATCSWVLVYTASTGSRMGGFKGDLNPVFSVFQVGRLL